MEEKEIWRLPKCVKTLKMMAILFYIEYFEEKDEIESEEIKKMIEDGKYIFFIGIHKNSLPDNISLYILH